MDETNFLKNQQIIADRLQEKLPNLECLMCKNKNLTLIEGFFAHDLQENFKSRHIGGKNVPTIPVACKNCGFVMEFSAGILGLLPKNDDVK